MSGHTVIGLLGTSLDRGDPADRWRGWRPTVSLFQHEDLLVKRLELLCDKGASALAEEAAGDIRLVSPETDVRLHPVDFRDPWDFEEVYATLHGFARGYPFDPERESYLVHITTGTHVIQICMYLLTESRHFPARLVQTAPPRRSRPGEIGRYAIIDLDLSRYDRIAQRFAVEQREAAAFLKTGIETRNAAFNRMIDEIEHVAVHSKAPILLTGPTGSGKSKLARRIHELKKLRGEVSGKFVEVNCATIRGDGAMSALFGHQRGAFTGATRDRAGHLREADGGVLFLDEIGELGVEEQAVLLSAIEEKRFYPLGSDRLASSDFQLICGTNRDLGAAVRSGLFREDLLARIHLWSFELPGLAQRREDIAPNIRFELAELTAATGRATRFNREALDRFLAFALAPTSPWCGNFRDLNAAIARMSTLAQAGRITRKVVDAEIERLTAAWSRLSGGPGDTGDSRDSDDSRDSGVAGDSGNSRDSGNPGITGSGVTGDVGSGVTDVTGVSRRTDAASARAGLQALLGNRAATMDEFDLVQLAHVVRVCRESPTLSAAGRRLFAASRARRGSPNDADRLRKYLARFGLDWRTLKPGAPRGA